MANTQDAAQLGNAWALHRAGRNEEAIAAFEEMLKGDANHIDALYGLGLAQRANHQAQAALDTFLRGQTLIQSANTADPAGDRFQMLKRLIQQRIAETHALTTRTA